MQKVSYLRPIFCEDSQENRWSECNEGVVEEKAILIEALKRTK